MTTKMLKAAIEAVNRGFHVFPTEPGGKRPLTTQRYPNGIPWSKVATEDISRVMQLWLRYPEANVGVACKPSGLFVVDCDIPKEDNLLEGTPYDYLHGFLGPRVDGETVLDQVAQRYGGDIAYLYDTYRVRTTRGGMHFYLSWPAQVHASQSSIVRGVLDVRGNGGSNGGYVLAAGSTTPDGPYDLVNDRDIKRAPSWLIHLCTERLVNRGHGARRVVDRSEWLGRETAQFGGIVETVRMAQEGNRNNSLSWAARCMCADGATVDEALELLLPATALGEQEARATIRSSYRVQERKMTQ